jgi:hypothetical protein
MSVARRELIAAGMLACRERLEALGFRRHEADIFTLPFAPRLCGWVALGRAVHTDDGSMVVTPHVGLLHLDIERLVATCARIPYHRYYPATVQTGTGLLMPEVTSDWVSFSPGEPIEEAADRVCQPIGEYAIPWMREYASLAGIQALDGNARYRTRLSTWRRAVLAYLLGHPDQARQYLNDAIAQIEREGRPQASSDVYRRFTQALEEQMARGTWHP